MIATRQCLGLPEVGRGALEDGPCVDAAVVHDGPLVQVTRWRCTHDGPALRVERAHTHLVVSVLVEGACEVVDGRWRRTLDPTAAVVHRPGATYRTRHPHGCCDAGYSLAFAPEVAEGLGPGSRPSDVVPVVPTPALSRTFAALARPGADTLVVEELALALLHQLLATPPLPRDPASHGRLVDRARAYVAAHATERIRLDDVARAAGCSPCHLSRVFRSQTGTTLTRWLLRRRLLEAHRRLLGEPEDLSELALRCGFASHAHLTERCTRHFGRPPSTIRGAAGT